MGEQRVYLVDIVAARQARERQSARDDKKRRQQWKRDQIKQAQEAKLTKPAKPAKVKKKKPKPVYVNETVAYRPGLGQSFYDTQEWRTVRYKALKIYGRVCTLCGATDAQFHVDHIKPRSLYPKLELELDNLQILCRDCNLGKSNTDSIDWRRGAIA